VTSAPPASLASLLRHPSSGIERFEASWTARRTPPHAHLEYPLTWTVGGQGRFRYRGGVGALPEGCALFVHPGEAHVLEAQPGASWCFHSLHLPAERIERCGRPAIQPGPWLVDDVLARRLAALWTHLDDTAADVARPLAAVADWLARRPGLDRDDDARDRGRHVRLGLAHLTQVLDRPVPLDELAAIAGCTASRLRRDFVRATGLPPHTWHLQRRIQEAKLLLAAGSSVAATALATGFVDQAHFTRHFSILVGVGPGRYLGKVRAD
jgi:AraC-like DNA-binding protein